MFNEADLPITADKRIYHLALRPEELAENIILVGDPERVPLIANVALESVETDVEHRGLRSMTGASSEGLRLSIITSGMGTPSLEIVLQEIAALNEIDFNTRCRKTSWPSLKLIRVGTSGGLHQDLPLGTAIISNYALGFDNTGLFYQAPVPDRFSEHLETEARALVTAAISEKYRFRESIRPYASRADSEITEALASACERIGLPFRIGITASNSGFFANQGRAVARVRPTVPDLDKLLTSLRFGQDELRVENMEMEASFLLHFSEALGYQAGVICPTIANRETNTFADNYLEQVERAALAAVKSFSLFS